MKHTKATPRRWFYFVIPIVSIILTLAIIELCLVMFHPIPFSIEKNMYFQPDPYTGYRLKPNSTGYFQQKIIALTNENGHRDDFVMIENENSSFRILVLGDSFTVGANVSQNESYTEVLEKTLQAKNHTSPVQVINAGVGGWEPFQYAQYYENYGREFSPDLILIGFFVGNDTYNQMTKVYQTRTAILGRRISKKAALDRFIHFKVFIYNHSNIARLMLNTGPTLAAFTRKDCSDFSNQYLEIQRKRLTNHQKYISGLKARARNGVNQIKRIDKLATQDTIPLGVVLIPDENQINRTLQHRLLTDEERGKFDFDMPQSMLKDMFADAGIPIIDLLPYFREDPRCLYMNDTHWTAEGHALAATVIYDSMTDDNIWLNITRRIIGLKSRGLSLSHEFP